MFTEMQIAFLTVAILASCVYIGRHLDKQSDATGQYGISVTSILLLVIMLGVGLIFSLIVLLLGNIGCAVVAFGGTFAVCKIVRLMETAFETKTV